MEIKFKKENTNEKQYLRKFSLNTLLSFVAYIAVGCIAVTIALTLIFKNNASVSKIFSSIGQAVAYTICIISALTWVKTHKQIPWVVCYVVFVVTIVVIYILTL